MAELRIAGAVALLVVGVACGGARAPAPRSAPAVDRNETESKTAGSTQDLSRWRAIAAAGGTLPEGRTAEAELPALVELLGEVDPEARDGLGYPIVVAWVGNDEILDAAAVSSFAGLLRARLREGIEAGTSEASFGRSFAALALSVIAARDLRAPVLSDRDLAALIEDLGWYAANENDLRGHTGEHGWLHAAAHTGDALKFLARSPRLSPAQRAMLLEAVAALVVRRHGYNLHHGEDARLAAPVLELLARDAVEIAVLEAWLDRLIAPLLQASDDYDPVLYAAQRNARNLLFTLVASIELREQRSATMERARELLLRKLRGG